MNGDFYQNRQDLIDMGFSPDLVEQALRKCGNDKSAAVEAMLTGVVDTLPDLIDNDGVKQTEHADPAVESAQGPQNQKTNAGIDNFQQEQHHQNSPVEFSAAYSSATDIDHGHRRPANTMEPINLPLPSLEEQKPANINNVGANITFDDDQINKAILASLAVSTPGPTEYFGDPHERMRKEGVPVGLRNVGNTCYFASLIQTYFNIPELRKAVLAYTPPKPDDKDDTKPNIGDASLSSNVDSSNKENEPLPSNSSSSKGNDSDEIGVGGGGGGESSQPIQDPEKEREREKKERRKMYSARFVLELQRIFALLTLSEQSYVDPSELVKAVVDDEGKQLDMSSQQDVGEFHMFLLERIAEGLYPYPKSATDENLHQIEDDEGCSEPESEPESGKSGRRLTIGSTASNKGKLKFSLSGSLDPKRDPITRLFHGVQKETLRYQIEENEEKGPELLQNRSGFGSLIVNITSGNVYNALDEYVGPTNVEFVPDTPAEGYEKEKEKASVIARKQVVFESLPDVLIIQLQRVQFDKDKKDAIKLMGEFKFDSRLDMYRYLRCSETEYRKRRAFVDQLISARKSVEEELGVLADYNGNGIALDKALKTSIEYLESRSKSHSHSQPKEITITTLQNCYEKVSLQMASLNSKIDANVNEVARMYNDMTGYPFQLHSILVHSGSNASSGHYWTYIYNDAKECWMRYNDHVVTQEEEKEVFQQGFGGDGQLSSAYCLIFKRMSMAEKGKEKEEKEEEEIVLPDSVKAFVQAENIKYHDEIAMYLKRQEQGLMKTKAEQFHTQFWEVFTAHKKSVQMMLKGKGKEKGKEDDKEKEEEKEKEKKGKGKGKEKDVVEHEDENGDEDEFAQVWTNLHSFLYFMIASDDFKLDNCAKFMVCDDLFRQIEEHNGCGIEDLRDRDFTKAVEAEFAPYPGVNNTVFIEKNCVQLAGVLNCYFGHYALLIEAAEFSLEGMRRLIDNDYRNGMLFLIRSMFFEASHPELRFPEVGQYALLRPILKMQVVLAVYLFSAQLEETLTELYSKLNEGEGGSEGKDKGEGDEKDMAHNVDEVRNILILTECLKLARQENYYIPFMSQMLKKWTNAMDKLFRSPGGSKLLRNQEILTFARLIDEPKPGMIVKNIKLPDRISPPFFGKAVPRTPHEVSLLRTLHKKGTDHRLGLDKETYMSEHGGGYPACLRLPIPEKDAIETSRRKEIAEMLMYRDDTLVTRYREVFEECQKVFEPEITSIRKIMEDLEVDERNVDPYRYWNAHDVYP